MKKIAYLVQMSYDVSNEEKEQAEKALVLFSNCVQKLKVANDHLDIMLTPFTDHPDISPDQIFNFRVQLRNFRDTAINNFNNFKLDSFKCIVVMQKFSSDTQTNKIIKSFISLIDNLENKVNDFAGEFSDLKSKDFINKITKEIKDINKTSSEITDLVNNRIKPYIRENILSKTWIDNIPSHLKDEMKERKPLVVELFQQNQEDFNKINN